MTLIRRTNPFGEMLSLRQAIDRLFEDSWVRPRNGVVTDERSLALDVRSTPDAYEIDAALTPKTEVIEGRHTEQGGPGK